MEQRLTWFAGLPAETRSWIGLVAQAGVTAFLDWYRDPSDAPEIPREVFGVAPRELARSVTLGQSIDMIRVTVDVLEDQLAQLANTDEEAALREAVVRYSRDVAFAAAEVYAAAAEQRGAWDARLEALVVDALMPAALRDAAAATDRTVPVSGISTLDRRVAVALQRDRFNLAVVTGFAVVAVLIGSRPPGDREPATVVTHVHRTAISAGLHVLASVQGPRLVVVMGGASTPDAAAAALETEFGPGPIVLGPSVPDLLAAGQSARAAMAGERVAGAWIAAPRIVHADELLPERALNGDEDARSALVDSVYRPLADAGGGLLLTLGAYLERGGSLEATARDLYVHANTVRYRLKRIADLTGYVATRPRDGFTLQIALAIGRLHSEPSL